MDATFLPTTRLGTDGPLVTRMGLGLAALGRPGYITLGHGDDLTDTDVDAMRQHAHRVLDAAWAAGMRYVDAARSYGRAESFLRSWIDARRLAPDALTVGSKWGYTYTADWRVSLPPGEQHEVKEHSRPVLDRQLEESRASLGAQLDLYQIHSATLDSGALDNRDVLARLGALRDGELLGRPVQVGFSVSGAQQRETILRGLDVQVAERPLFGAVQATWNLLEPSAGEALRQAHEAGVGVIVKEALANGRLTARNDRAADRERIELLTAAARAMGITVDALALAAVLAQPWASVVLSGAAAVEHVQSNAHAFDVTWDESTAERLDALRESAEAYWSTRGELAWN